MAWFAPPTASAPQSERPLLFRDANLVNPETGTQAPGNMLVVDGLIAEMGPGAGVNSAPEGIRIIDCGGKVLAPGLIDMQVETGEPGDEHRETLASASLAAAAGGVTTLCCTPDTDPVIDDAALVDFLLRRARDTAIVKVVPIAALTKGLEGTEMAEIGLLQEAGARAFSQGCSSITNARLMRRALTYATDFDLLVMHHVEDPDLVGAGVMHESEASTRLGLSGIPDAAETVILDRDLRLVALTGGRYHASQISSAQSLPAIRAAKAAGLPVTCGVSINHITLNEHDIGTYRTFLKMSPPLRGEQDRLALVDALADGTIDVVVSAHNPRDVDEKRQPFAEAEPGAIGLETMLSAALRLVHADAITLPQLFRALSLRPAELLGLPCGRLSVGAPADLVMFDPDRPWVVEAEALSSRSKNTPFDGALLTGRVLSTFVAGREVYAYAED
jgi:dihydroorotase